VKGLLNLKKFFGGVEKNCERKNENSDAMRTLDDPLKDAVERGDEGGAKFGGGWRYE
jgi:hypothetical protein